MFKKIIFSIFTLYTLSGFFILPYFLKPEILKNANNYIDAKVSLQSVSFNPYIFKLSLHGLTLTKKKQKLLSIKELRCDVEPYKLFMGTLYLKELLVLGMDLHIVKDKNGVLNLTTLLKPQPNLTKKPTEPSQPIQLNELPHIHIGSLGIDESHIVFDDSSRATPFHFVLNRFRTLLNNFDTKQLSHSNANIRILAKLEDGGLIDIKTAITQISNNPLNGVQTQTTLQIKINRLYNEWQYLRDSMKLEVADGSLSLLSNITLNTKSIDTTHIYDTSLSIQNLRIKPKDAHHDILHLNSLTLSKLDAKPLQDEINIKNILLDKLYIKAARLHDGSINWQNYLASEEKPKEKTEQTDVKTEKKQLHFLLQNFTLQNSQILFDDKLPSPKVHIALDDMKLTLHNITLTPKEWLDYNFTTKINQDALFLADGKLSLTPLKQEGNVTLKKLALKFLNPYIAQNAYVKLQDGYLNFSTKEKFIQANTPIYKAQGKMSLDELFVNDTRDNKSLLSFSHFKLKDFLLDSKTNKLLINNAVLDAFYVDAMVAKNKEFNLAKLTKKTPSKKVVKKKKEKKESQPIAFLLKKLLIKDGSAKFADLSLPIAFKTDIHDLNGALYTLTNIAGRKTAMKLNGEIDRYGSTKIDLKIDASNPKKYTQVNMNFSNLAMNSLSGYTATFAGHKIDDGKLYLNLGYNLRNSVIKGKNSIIIKKIKIGDELKDENTTSLPLGFIVALLEDKDGIIDINMPVEGDVDAPDFKYGSFVFKTFFNLLVKAVISPFSFLGSMMGIDADQLKSIDFEAGSVAILPPQREKLDELTKMLIKRPKISLSIEGGYNTKVDTQELQKLKLLKEATPLTKEKKPLENENELTVALLEKIYLKHSKKEKLSQLKKSTKKEDFREKLLLQTTMLIPVSNKELQTLAQQREKEILHYLISKGIKQTRVKLLITKENDTEKSNIPTALNLVVK